MTFREQRLAFEADKNNKPRESVILKFEGVDAGWDIYNPSTPFTSKGKRYIFGRIERRKAWARSWCGLFEETGKDRWSLVKDAMPLSLEDPTVAIINGEIVLEGTHIRRVPGSKEDFDSNRNGIDNLYGYFYRGKDPKNLVYFATGPDFMKDIRLVQMKDGRVGVFSRPRGKRVLKETGRETQIGFTIIDSLQQLTAQVIESAPYLPDMFGKDEFGGCNQALLLKDGMIGVIAHMCYYETDTKGVKQNIYMNASFVLDTAKHRAQELKIIGTRASYPKGVYKLPYLKSCVFTSGIVPRKDGLVDLYSGLGDVYAGRIAIPDPFANHGGVAWKKGQNSFLPL